MVVALVGPNRIVSPRREESREKNGKRVKRKSAHASEVNNTHDSISEQYESQNPNTTHAGTEEGE